MEQKLSEIGNNKTCPVAVLMKEGKILLGLRNYTPDKWKKISVWTCSGGRCDQNETIKETLKREIKEETGIDEFTIIKYLGEVQGAKKEDIVPLFLCKTIQEPKLLEPQKFTEWKWFEPENIPGNFINNYAKKRIEKSI